MEEIGLRLRQAREAKGISLEAAEEETRIRRKYLLGLENGDASELPGEVYLKGFLRTYGNFLGLDGEALVEEYKQGRAPRRTRNGGSGSALSAGEAAPTAKSTPPDESARAAAARESAAAAPREPERPAEAPPVRPPVRPPDRPADATAAPTPAPARRAGPRRHELEPATPAITVGKPRLAGKAVGPGRQNLLTVLLLIVAVGVVSYLGWLIALNLTAGPTDGGPTAKGPTTPGAQTPAPSPPKAVDPVPTPPPVLPDPPKVTMVRGQGDQVTFVVPAAEITVKLEFGSSERLWMQAFTDGTKAYEGFPVDRTHPVPPLEWKGKDLSLRMGHMNGVSVTVNGQRFETPLEKGPYTLLFKSQPQ